MITELRNTITHVSYLSTPGNRERRLTPPKHRDTVLTADVRCHCGPMAYIAMPSRQFAEGEMASARREYRVGLAGFGGRGAGLARFWQGVPGARIVAVADPIPERLDAAEAALGAVACYADHREMLEQADLDILTIG